MVNKKYYFLDDQDWLIDHRKRYTRAELAESLSLFAGSIRWAELKLSPEQRKEFKFDRSPHTNTIKKRKRRKVKT